MPHACLQGLIVSMQFMKIGLVLQNILFIFYLKDTPIHRRFISSHINLKNKLTLSV